MDEQTLVNRLEKDDPNAVRELYRQYRPKVRSVVRSNVDRDSDVEDVTQDVLLKVYQRIDSFRRNSALWTWMYRIAVNEARMRVRKNDRRPRPVESNTLNAIIEKQDRDVRPRPDQQVAVKDLVETVHEYLEDSKETNRKIFIELEFGRSTKEELGERFDLSRSAVKARLHRMRVGLRERIREEYLDDGN
ncbi:MAG: RNA polymerase sigma factor [Bradymonadaceae bacterium]